METLLVVEESSPSPSSSSSILFFALGLVCLRCVCMVTSAILSSLRFLMVWNEIYRLHQPVQLDLVTNIYEPTTATQASTASEDNCPICLVPYEEGDVIIHGGTCQHKFHSHCLSQWLKTESSCPCCRVIMVGRKYADDETVLDVETASNWLGVLEYFKFSMSIVGFS